MISKARVIRGGLSVSAALAILTASGIGSAAEPWASSPYRSKDYATRRDAGLVLALRGGVDFPFTDWDAGFHMDLPLRADVGVHLDDRFSFGAYFRYEKWLGVASGINDYTFGMNAQLRAKSDMAFDPWGAFGAGIRKTAYGSALSTTAIEFANVQLGADYALAKTFFIGPYIETAFAYDLDLETVDARGMAGLRVAFEP